MQRLSCSLLLLSLLFAFATASSTPSPFFAFNLLRSYSEKQSSQIIADSSSLFPSLLSNIVHTQQPEILVAFVDSKLSSADFTHQVNGYSPSEFGSPSAFTHLRNYLTSTPSVSVPNMIHRDSDNSKSSVASALTNAFTKLNKDARVVELTVGPSMTCDQAIHELKNHVELYNNAVSDIALIRFHDQADVHAKDLCMHKVIESVSSATNKKYAAIFTAEPSHNIQLNFASQSAAPAMIQLQAQVTAGTGIKFMTPLILFGLMFSLLFLIALYCGVSCLLSIQTPLRFPTRKLAINKEY